jgi:hypothetical protein
VPLQPQQIGPALVGTTLAPDPQSVERSRDRRAECFTARTALWTDSTLKRVRRCGRVSVRHSGEVAVRLTAGRAGFAGVSTCGSVWACPVCARKIATERQKDLQAAVEFWEAQGGAVALGSFTVSHRAGQSLKAVWDAVSDGWKSITSGRVWKRNAATFSIEGWHRVVEVTHGRNGWHVHIHVVLFLHHGLGLVERAALTAAMLGRWNTGIGKHGFSSSAQHGADIRMVHGAESAKVLADYFTKGVYQPDGSAGSTVALEVTRGDLKSARGDSETPFQILRRYVAGGEVDALDTWQEWERGSKGRRQTAWSRGFREVVRLCAEKTDEQIAGEEAGSALDDVVILTGDAWRVVRWQAWAVLDVLEQQGGAMLRAWLDRHGLEYRLPGL